MVRDLALIGCGQWGRNLARVFDQLGVLHTICDPNPAYQNHGLRMVQHVQESLDENIKKVVIATSSETHFELASMALRADKDVFVEKPLCFRYTEALVLLKLARDQQKILMVGHILRYHTSFLQLQQIVRDGLIGNVIEISARRKITGPGRSGGVLLDLSVHDLSMALALPIKLSSVRVNMEAQADSPQKISEFIVTGDQGMLVFDDTKAWNEKLKHNELYVKPMPAEPLELECKHFLKACKSRIKPRTDVEESCRIFRILDSFPAADR